MHFEGMGGLNVTDVRRDRIPLLWSTVRRWPKVLVLTWGMQNCMQQLFDQLTVILTVPALYFAACFFTGLNSWSYDSCTSDWCF